MTTRRGFLVGALLAAGAVVAGVGRFAFGNTFEDHVAATLGTSLPVATKLLDRVRDRIGDREYDTRAAEFLAATTFPGTLAPRTVRDHAVSPLIAYMLATPAEELYAMQVLSTPPGPCSGLGKA